MSRLNPEGVRFVHRRTGELSVNSMDEAANVIEAAIRKHYGEARKGDHDFARHLAWMIGFDTLIDDRKAIHGVTSLVVEDAA